MSAAHENASETGAEGEAEWSPAEAGAAVAAALDQVGPGPWSPPDSLGAEIFHSPACKCGHKKVLHAGADAGGRCVNRSCGCGKYNPRELAR